MRDDRGSASVLAVAILAVVILMGMAVATVAGLAADRSAARSAADLAALAGAYEVRRGLATDFDADFDADFDTGAATAAATGDPCAVSRRTARANSATMIRCQVFGDGSVEVSVASGKAKASARAGPQK